MIEVVVLVGLPAAGKSSYFREHLAATHAHISKDLMRNVRNKEKRQAKLLREALSSGRSAVRIAKVSLSYSAQLKIASATAHIIAGAFSREVSVQFEVTSSQASSEVSEEANAIMMIAPYWSSGTWVFDDPSRNLTREPFVSGVPEILTELVKPIPNAKNGFRLLFSARPFPGYQAQYTRVESEYSGTWYQTDEGKTGWLCPALFKYFSKAPENLFVRAEPLH